MSGEIIEAGLSLELVTDRIRALTALSFSNACQIGKLLIDAKPLVKHGEWAKYLADLGYKPSSANNLMLMCERYGEFGEKLQTFGTFSPSQAVALFGLPDGEREAFLEAHPDAETMSVRELKAQIAAEKERAENAETVTAALREQLAVAQEEIGAAHQKAADWQKQARDWQDKNSEDKKVERKLRADVTALETELAAARAQAGRLPPAEMSRLRDELLDEAVKVTAESHRADLADRDATIERLKDELQQAQEAAEQGDEQQTLLSLAGQAASDVGSALNVLCGYYKKFKPRYPRIADAIRNLAVKQIETIQKGFDIEPV